MLMMEIPPVLLTRCPGCARALAPGCPGCDACGLGVAGVPAWWSQDQLQTQRLWPFAIAAGASALCAALSALVLVLVPHPPVVVTAGAVTVAVIASMLTLASLVPWFLVLLTRARKVTSWTYATEWGNELVQGYVQTRALLVNGKLAHATGQLVEYGQPAARRFGSRSAPLPSQRRFVRWLMGETVAGRARVAELRKITWEINGPAPRRAFSTRPAVNLEPARSEERRLMVAPDTSELAPPGLAGTVYAAHLKEPRPVADLWFALSRQAEKLPDSGLGEHEIPDWAHELEAALTAEVAPLVMN